MKKLKLKQETAHEMELAIDTFQNTLEALEEYIEKANYYPNWSSKRQIYRKSIADSNDTLEGFEDLFLTQLLIVKATINKKPDFFRKEIQKEFHKWINSVGINDNSCPEKLGRYLFTIYEVLEGRGEQFVNQTRELVKDVKLNPQDSLKFFSELQEPLNKNKKRGEILKGKSWNEVGNERRIDGDEQQGEKAFGKIAKIISNQGDYNFYQSSYYSDHSRGLDNLHKHSGSKVIQEVKNNPQDWNLDEIPTETGSFNRTTKQEFVLFHRNYPIESFGGLTGGRLSFDGKLIYRWENFNAYERFEIKQAKNISDGYLTNEEIKWIVKEVGDNPSIWRIGEVQGKTLLIHNSAQGKDSEIGTLIHKREVFSQEQWQEVYGIIRTLWFSGLSEKIRKSKNDWIISTIDDSYEALIHKSALMNGGGKINVVSGEFYRKDKFSDQEWAEIRHILVRQEMIEEIRKNNFINVSIVNERNERVEEVLWVVRKFYKVEKNERGYLIFDPENMRVVKDLTEVEKSELGIANSKVEQSLQVLSDIVPSESNNEFAGIVVVLSVIFLVIVGMVVKKLRKK